MGKLLSGRSRRRTSPRSRPSRRQLREAHASAQKRPLLSLEEARRAQAALVFDDTTVADARRSSARATSTSTLAELVAVDRLVAVLPHLGAVGPLPGDPRRSEEGRRRAQAVRRRAGAARRRSSTSKLLTRARDLRLLPGRLDRRRRDRRARRRIAPASSRGSRCRASRRTRTSASRSRTSSRRSRRTARPPRRVHRHRRHRHRRARRARSRRDHDDYSAIMAKALADRLAEAARRVAPPPRPRRVGLRRDRGARRTSEILAENYRGIRPAFGYPACPDHAPEGHAVHAARQRRAPRRLAHRELRDVPDRLGLGPLLRAPEGELLLGRPHRVAPGGLGTQEACRRPRPPPRRPRPRPAPRRAGASSSRRRAAKSKYLRG